MFSLSRDDHLIVHKEFNGKKTNTCANTILAVNKDTLIIINLNLNKCRGQCYDWAGAMACADKGVAMQISSKEPRTLFIVMAMSLT